MADEVKVDSRRWAELTGFAAEEEDYQATFDDYDMEKIRRAWAAVGHTINVEHIHTNTEEIAKCLGTPYKRCD